VPGLPAGGYRCLCAGEFDAVKGRQGGPGAANRLSVLLAVLRLPHVATDVLITLHTATYIGPASAAAAHAGAGPKAAAAAAAPALMAAVLRGLEVRDWSLFG
jgi:hypothetical protein